MPVYLYTMQAMRKTLQWDWKQLENMFSFESGPLHPPGRMKSKHDCIRRHAHSPDRVFKGLAKLIKKAHLLQWPPMRDRPGILWIVLIVS